MGTREAKVHPHAIVLIDQAHNRGQLHSQLVRVTMQDAVPQASVHGKRGWVSRLLRNIMAEMASVCASRNNVPICMRD